MGILGRIRKAKEEHNKNQNVKVANELKKLKTQRVREEGRVKILKARDREKARIKKAKLTQRKSSKFHKVLKVINEETKKTKLKNKRKDLFTFRGPQF